jgi:hypothetical protein
MLRGLMGMYACIFFRQFTDMNCHRFKRKIWEEQKQIYLRGAALWEEPMREVVIPHKHAKNGDGKEIPLYVRLPKGVKKGEGKKCSVVLLLTGLDGHRPDNTGVRDIIPLQWILYWTA